MPNIAKCSVFVGGTFLVTLGGFMIALWPALNDLILTRVLNLTPKSITFFAWKETPIPIYLEFYMFNWTNSEEVNDPNKKLSFTEHGPYVFKEHHKRVNLTWMEDNSTVEYDQIRTYVFQPDLSNGSLDDIIITVNPIALSAAYTVRRSTFLQFWVNVMLNEFKITVPVAKTVGEFLFDGYEDPLLDLINTVPNFTMPFDKFGWFYGRNNSWQYDGRFDMYTGRDNISKLGVLAEWNNVNHTIFNYGDCSDVQGTTGELWPPMDGKEEAEMFITDLCRSIRLEYAGKTERVGLTGNLYVADQKTLDNGQVYPENRCYCGSEEDESCVPAGAMNVSKCKFGAPAFVSLPHFYKADPSYRDKVDIPPPNPDTDELYIAIEPKTGIPLEVEAKIQINLLMQPFKNIKLFKNVPYVFVPMFHFNQNAKLTSKLGTYLNIFLHLDLIGYIIYSILIVAGLSIFFSGIYMTIWGRWAKVAKPEDRAVLIDDASVFDNVET